MLGDQQHRAAPFAAERESLDQAECRKQQGRGGADRGMRGQQPDRECRTAHQQQAEHQQLLAAYPVAVVPEDERPDGTGGEADGDVRNDSSVPTSGSESGKKSLGKTIAAADPYRKKSYHSIVVPTRLAATTRFRGVDAGADAELF